MTLAVQVQSSLKHKRDTGAIPVARRATGGYPTYTSCRGEAAGCAELILTSPGRAGIAAAPCR